MERHILAFENAEARPTPVLLLGALRAIDPTVELVYPGEGRWWLGSVRPLTQLLQAKAERILQQMETFDAVHRNPRTVMLAHLNLHGFRLIETYYGHDPSAEMEVARGTPAAYWTTILRDFEERDQQWRRDGGEARYAAELEKAKHGDPAEAERIRAHVAAYAAQDGRDHYRRLVKGRTTFGAAGQTGGAKAIEQLTSTHLILPGDPRFN